MACCRPVPHHTRSGGDLKPFDDQGAFRRTVAGNNLSRAAVRSAGFTVFSSGLALGIQVIATVVLARLLSPKDFGVVTMVSTFSLLFLNFGLNGLTEAILQRDQLTHQLVSNLFWINLGGASCLTLGFASAGSLLARFYGNPAVVQVTAAMSLTILLTSTTVVHLALLKRAMLFSVTSAIDVFARAASVAVSIALGRAGWGYWALVAGAIAAPLVTSIVAWSLCRWTPGLPRRVPGTRSMILFSIHTYGRFTFNYFARNADNLLVGWRFDAIALGFYKKAYDLFALSAGQLTAPLTNVAVSALSRLEPRSAEYRKALINAVSVMAFIGMALAGSLTLIGQDLIRLLLGPGWERAGRVFTFFGPGVGVMILYYIHGWIHLSIGKADRWLRWATIEAGVTFVLFVLALPWGLEGIAFAWTASFWILTIPAFWYAGVPIGLSALSVLAATSRYIIASLLSGIGSFVFLRRLPLFAGPALSLNSAAIRVGIASALFAGLYLLAVIILHRGAAPVYQMARLLTQFTSRPKPELNGPPIDACDTVTS